MGREAGRRRAAAVLVVIAGAVGGPLGASASTTGAPDSTTTTPASASGARQLPAVAVVGQSAEVTTRIKNSTLAGMVEVVVSMTTVVTAVNPADGSYTTRSTIGTVDVPVGAEIAGDGVNALVARSFEQSFQANGAAVPAASTLIDAASMTPEQQASGRDLIDAVSLISIGFPAEPVAVGAAWTADGTIGRHGTIIPVSYQCRLIALDAATYTMEVTYTQAFSQPSDAGAIEATIAGWGTIVGSVSNPLSLSATLHQSVDGIQGVEPLNNDTAITFDGTG
ncbi:MAG TPA: hypothetical protein VFO97_01070 [Desertimonas sp.]|nr:hypothetical protein [Desertimonas sp.]